MIEIYLNKFADGFIKLRFQNYPLKQGGGCLSSDFDEQPKEPHQRSFTRSASSVYRSRRKVESLLHMNSFNWFITLTFSDNISDNAELRRKGLRRLSYLVSTGVINSYLVVPELQRKGKLHFHGFFNLPYDSVSMVDSGTVKVQGVEKPVQMSTYYRFYNGQYYQTVYNFAPWNKLGFSVCYNVDDFFNDRLHAVRYLQKYMTKDGIIPGWRMYYRAGLSDEQPQRFHFAYSDADINAIDLKPISVDFEYREDMPYIFKYLDLNDLDDLAAVQQLPDDIKSLILFRMGNDHEI